MFSVAVSSQQEQTAKAHVSVVAEVAAVSESLLLYRNIVAAYASTYPSMIGAVPDVSLSLPSWYAKNPSFGNYVASGKSYVFYTQSLPGLVGELARKTESTNVGTNQNGVLSAPNKSNSGIVLPAQIPNGSVVLIQ